MFRLSVSSGRARCGYSKCNTRNHDIPYDQRKIPKGTHTVRAKLGSGKYAKTYCRDCFITLYGAVMKTLISYDGRDFEGAYQVLMDYWDRIPEGERDEVNERLKMCGL